MWAVGVAMGLLSGLLTGWVRPSAAPGLSAALFWLMVGLSVVALAALIYIDLQGRARRQYRDRNQALALILTIALLGGAGAIALFEFVSSRIPAVTSGFDPDVVNAALSTQIGPLGVIAALAFMAVAGVFLARWTRGRA